MPTLTHSTRLHVTRLGSLQFPLPRATHPLSRLLTPTLPHQPTTHSHFPPTTIPFPPPTRSFTSARTHHRIMADQSPYNKHEHRASAEDHVEGDVASTKDTSVQDTHPTGKDNWKERAPYRIHDDGEGFEVKHEGSCHCGKVRYQLSRETPLAAKYCHCTTCQVIHGAPFQWAAIFHKTDINFTHGHHDLAWYDSQGKTTVHKLPCKVSCAYCRTPIMDEGRNMILLFPTLIKFKNKEERKKFDPQCHMFYPQRVVDVPDGKTKWTGIDQNSEVMEDADKQKL